MNLRIGAAVMILQIFAANVGLCTEGEIPSLTRQTAAGTWEALVGEWMVYRLQIDVNGRAYLAQVTSPDKRMQTLYRADQPRVENGRITMRFVKLTRNSGPPEILVLRGQGFGNREQGRIEGKIQELDKGQNISGTIELTFIKPANRVRHLAAFSMAAEKLIRAGK